MDEQEVDLNEESVDIEQIMRQIREQILSGKSSLQRGGKPIVPAGGDRFSPEFYEQLYYAGLAYDQVGVKMHVTKLPIPVIGSLLSWLRGKVHQLVLYYVNQVAAQQIKVNTHLLQALSLLSQELEAAEPSQNIERNE